MIDIKNEKDSALTASEVNSIISFAIQECDNDGFLNVYVFERAMYVYLYLTLVKDDEESDSVRAKLSDDGVLAVWDSLLRSGKIGDMLERCADDVRLVEDAGEDLFNSYIDYSHSVRGAIVGMQVFGSDMIQQAIDKFVSMTSQENYKNIMNIANDWGLNSGKAEA